MGPPYLMIEPMEDAVTTAFPSQRRENKLTETSPARVCIAFSVISTSLVSNQRTTLATGESSDRVKCMMVIMLGAADVFPYVSVRR